MKSESELPLQKSGAEWHCSRRRRAIWGAARNCPHCHLSCYPSSLSLRSSFVLAIWTNTFQFRQFLSTNDIVEGKGYVLSTTMFGWALSHVDIKIKTCATHFVLTYFLLVNVKKKTKTSFKTWNDWAERRNRQGGHRIDPNIDLK